MDLECRTTSAMLRCPQRMWRTYTSHTSTSTSSSDLVGSKACANLNHSLYGLRLASRPSHFLFLAMSSLFGSSDSAPTKVSENVKTTLIQQVHQEAAMNNARTLIGVRHRAAFRLPWATCIAWLTTFCVENQRELFPELRSFPGFVPVIQRKHLFVQLHGEVYRNVEPHQSHLHQPDWRRKQAHGR